MDSDAHPLARAGDTSPASPGHTGPPRTFMGATAIVGAIACLIALLMVASGSGFWLAIGMIVIIMATLVLVIMHILASVARNALAMLVVALGYATGGAAILRNAAQKGTPLLPGPGLLAVVAFVGAALTALLALRAFLRRRHPLQG